MTVSLYSGYQKLESNEKIKKQIRTKMNHNIFLINTFTSTYILI